jgi:hypothetical protein
MILRHPSSNVEGQKHREDLAILIGCAARPGNLDQFRARVVGICNGEETYITIAPTATNSYTTIIQDIRQGNLLIVLNGMNLLPGGIPGNYQQIPAIIRGFGQAAFGQAANLYPYYEGAAAAYAQCIPTNVSWGNIQIIAHSFGAAAGAYLHLDLQRQFPNAQLWSWLYSPPKYALAYNGPNPWRNADMVVVAPLTDPVPSIMPNASDDPSIYAANAMISRAIGIRTFQPVQGYILGADGSLTPGRLGTQPLVPAPLAIGAWLGGVNCFGGNAHRLENINAMVALTPAAVSTEGSTSGGGFNFTVPAAIAESTTRPPPVDRNQERVLFTQALNAAGLMRENPSNRDILGFVQSQVTVRGLRFYGETVYGVRGIFYNGSLVMTVRGKRVQRRTIRQMNQVLGDFSLL